MKKTINTTAVSAGLFLMISIVLWVAIPYGIKDTSASTDIGPQAFPRTICGAMGFLSALQLILLATGVQKGNKMEFQFSDYTRVLLAMALSIATIICALFVNIVLAAVICAFLFLLILREKDWRYYAAVLVTGVLLFLLMRYVMRIRF